MNKFQEFLKAKSISEADLKAKSAEELAGIYNEYNDLQRREIESAVAQKASKDDIQTLKSELQESQAKQLDALNAVLKEQGIVLKRISDGMKQPDKATDSKSLKETLSGIKSQLDDLKGKRQPGFIEFEVSTKVVGNMSITSNVTGEIPQAFREPGMNRIQDRPTFVRNYINTGTISDSNVVSWVEQANREGVAGGTAEGAPKNQIDFNLITSSESVKKRTAYITVTQEMMKDISFMESEIRNELLILLNLDVDNQTLQGDGLSNNLNGIITQATVFAAGAFAAAINNANNYDVLRVAINQIMLANFMPNVIFCNPTDVTGMQLEKGTDGHYIKFPFVSEAGDRLLNIPIVVNTGVPAGTFLVMDGTRSTLFDREAITIQMGYNADDFVNNRVTVLAEWRGVHRIKGNDLGAFVTGSFATAKAALETP